MRILDGWKTQSEFQHHIQVYEEAADQQVEALRDAGEEIAAAERRKSTTEHNDLMERADQARLRFAEFVRLTAPLVVPAGAFTYTAHVEAIAEHLQAVARGESCCRRGDMTEKKLRAALLIAEGRLANAEIAERVGVSARTVDRWKLLPAVQHKIAAHQAVWEKRRMEEECAARNRRLRELDDLSQGIGSRSLAGFTPSARASATMLSKPMLRSPRSTPSM